MLLRIHPRHRCSPGICADLIAKLRVKIEEKKAQQAESFPQLAAVEN